MARIDVDNLPVDDRDGNFEPIPTGIYDLHIIETRVAEKEKGVNEMLTLQLEVIGPTHAGRQIFVNLCYMHPNFQTQDIANKAIKSLCTAIGHRGLLDTDDLSPIKFKPFKARVGIEPGKNDYPAKNKISSYIPLDGHAPASAPAPRQAAQSAPAREPAHAAAGAPAGGKKRPWG